MVDAVQETGQRVLSALRASSITSRHAVWLGSSPVSDLVYVVRATRVPGSDLALMVASCKAVPGISDVRYEIDCGDRAVRVVVTPSAGPVASPPPPVLHLRLLLELASVAWAASRLLFEPV